MAETTDPNLIEGVKRFLLREASRQIVDAADLDARRRFEETYSPLIERFCRRRRFRKADAEDLQQRVWLQVWKYLVGFERRGKGSFRSWLTVLARNETFTKRREQERRRGFEQPQSNGVLDGYAASSPSALDEIIQELDRELARATLLAMENDPSERTRYFAQLLRLRYWEEEPTSALAARFSKTEENIRTDLVRARKAYEKRLEERGRPGS